VVHSDPKPGPAKTSPLGQVGTVVKGGTGHREISDLIFQPGKVQQGSQLDVPITGPSRSRSGRRE
jgi:hypothetical protein